jgi:hypothetical protein
MPLPGKGDPLAEAATEAIERINHGDLNGAAHCLENMWGLSPERIPEIGQTVLEPKFIQSPASAWEREVVETFNGAALAYHDGNYSEAANRFVRGFKSVGKVGFALNAIAACIKAGEPRRAVNLLSTGSQQRLSQRRELGWRLIYNLAIAYLHLKRNPVAVKLVQRYLRRHRSETTAFAGPLTGLIVAICNAPPGAAELRGPMAAALESLRRSANPPSEELVIALAWARLTQADPDAKEALKALQALKEDTAASGAIVSYRDMW